MRKGQFSVFPVVVVYAASAFAGFSQAGCTARQSTDATASAPTHADQARGESPEDREYVDTDGVVRRGESLSSGPSLSVNDVVTKAASLDGKVVKVTGTVGRVCGKSGCWFELKGAHSPTGIRITSKGYRFFVPSKAKGMRATLEGDLKVRMLDAATAQHLADDLAEGTGQPAEQVTAPVPEISIAAVALEMRPGSEDG